MRINTEIAHSEHLTRNPGPEEVEDAVVGAMRAIYAHAEGSRQQIIWKTLKIAFDPSNFIERGPKLIVLAATEPKA